MEADTIASWGTQAGSYEELGKSDDFANPPVGDVLLPASSPVWLACCAIVRATRSSMSCVEEKFLELEFLGVSFVVCAIPTGNRPGQDSTCRAPMSPRWFLDGSTSLSELGAFITIDVGSKTGRVRVIVEFHDRTQLCSVEFTSGSAAAMFCQLIVGAIQLHDPEAIIVVKNNRDL